jgi:hypothetical protein
MRQPGLDRPQGRVMTDGFVPARLATCLTGPTAQSVLNNLIRSIATQPKSAWSVVAAGRTWWNYSNCAASYLQS